jgi:uncharacterized protein
MKTAPALALCAALALPALAASPATDTDWKKDVQAWRARAGESLAKDNGWLTLAGRYVVKPGVNTFGTGPGNDIVFPRGLGPERMGTVDVPAAGAPGKVTVKLAPGLEMTQEGIPMADKVMDTSEGAHDWVTMGRASFYVIEHQGRYVLRLADSQSPVRAHFGARVWYPVKPEYRVTARFMPYDPPRTLPIVNVIDEVSDEPSPGYVEFTVHGRKERLDVVGNDDDGLFIVFRDATAGKTTYGPGRFLFIDHKPGAGETFPLDLNRAYNPPCAFSEFTTCPLPPKQNILKTAVEAGEKYPPRKKG